MAALHPNAPLWQMPSMLDRDDVELVLARFEPPPVHIHAVWLSTGLLPAKTQLFVEFLVAGLKQERLCWRSFCMHSCCSA